MKNKTTRFLAVSLIGVALLCVCVFSFLAIHMGGRSSRTINEMGSLYMSSMSQQISTHFESIIDIQMDQLEALAGQVDMAAMPQGRASMQSRATASPAATASAMVRLCHQMAATAATATAAEASAENTLSAIRFTVAANPAVFAPFTGTVRVVFILCSALK